MRQKHDDAMHIQIASPESFRTEERKMPIH